MKKNSDLKKKRLALIRQSKRYLGVKNLKSKEDRLKVYKEAALAAAMAEAEADRVDFIETFYKLTPAQKRMVKNLRAQDKKMRADALELGRIFVEEEFKLEKQKKERGRKTKTFQQRLEELKQELPTLSPEAKRVRIARLKKAMMEETPYIRQPDYLIKKYLEEEGIRKKSQTQKEKERKQKKKEEKYQKWLQTPEGKAYLKQKQKEEREIEKMEREIEREKKRMEKRLQKLEKEEEMKRKEKKK